MFGKKKNVVVDTIQDKKIKELRSDRYDAWRRVEEATEKVIVRNGVIDLYPDGADKDKAKRDADSAKVGLLAAMAVYDDLRNQYIQALNAPFERATTKDWHTVAPTSHEIIERTYEKFYKKS